MESDIKAAARHELLRRRAAAELERRKSPETTSSVESGSTEQSYVAGLVDSATNLFGAGPHITAAEAAILGKTPDGDWFDYSESASERYNDALEAESRKLQKRIAELVQVLEIDSDNSCASITEAINYFKNAQGTLESSAPLDFMDKEAIDYCKDDVGKLKVSFYKIRLFIAIADSIKSGKLCFNYSYRYRAINNGVRSFS